MNYIEKEIEIIDHISHPHLFSFGDEKSKKNISQQIFKNYEEKEILIIDPYGFLIGSVFAGLTEKHIEYIAKNAPKDYKDNILKLLQDQEALKGVFEIAKAMDDDLGRGSTQNQDRARNVIQYIKDNRIAFEF